VILDGKAVSQTVLAEVRTGVERLRARTGKVPTLAVVLVGDFAPSRIYVANKKKAADAAGIASRDEIHPAGLPREALLKLLRALNDDRDVNGILLQLPLPDGLDEDEAINAIAPEKDVTA
jgi:methylenetetrahydrofolate dehydrogenase (NADP+)/methenyltetrahydrofolate cyclohydrolase